MTYAWCARNRVCHPRMVWDEDGRNYNDPLYELVKLQAGDLRGCPRLERFGVQQTRIEQDRDNRRAFAGKLGEWPLYQWGKPIKRIAL